MAKSVASMLREIDQVKKSDLGEDVKAPIIALLKKQIAEFAVQTSLDLAPAKAPEKGSGRG